MCSVLCMHLCAQKEENDTQMSPKVSLPERKTILQPFIILFFSLSLLPEFAAFVDAFILNSSIYLCIGNYEMRVLK